MKLFVERKLTRLPECFSAALIWTFEWFLTCVDVRVFLQVLAKSELLIANHACEGLGWLMHHDHLFHHF